MIIPNIDLRDNRIGALERLLAIPSNVVLEIEFVAVRAHAFWERKVPSLLRIANVCPRLQWARDSHAVIVDLIAATNHDMEGLLIVHAQDIIPQCRPRPCIDICAHAEAVAGMEHDAH